MERCRTFVLAILLILGSCSYTLATVGGPKKARLLGHDPLENRVYYLVRNLSEGGDPIRVYYLDLKSRNSSTPVWVESWHRGEERDIYDLVSKLEKRLVPLVEDPEADLDIRVESSAGRPYEIPTYRRGVDSYQLMIALAVNELEGSAEITAYCRRDVVIKGWYRVPNQPYALVSLAYTGDPYETCYAKPAVVLLGIGVPPAKWNVPPN